MEKARSSWLEARGLVGKRALVMGLGLHDGGYGVTKFLAEAGAHVTVTDLRSKETLAPTLEKLKGLSVQYVIGEHREDDFRQADIVVKNPAVPRESKFLEIARQAGASIEMEMTLFFKLCPSRQILGITGTRGKTSTTVLAGEIMRAWKPETVVAGNLRISALEKLPQITPETYVVLELSSWQLEGLGEQELSPRYAAVTNMSPDHLNRYRDMEDYADAKRHIVRWQTPEGIAIINADDPIVSGFDLVASGKVQRFSLTDQHADVYLKDGAFYWTDANGVAQSCPADLLKVPGKHSQANALAAIGLVSAAGCPKEAIVAGLTNFRGVADRLELVRELEGVRFYNDTTATSPAGTIVALDAFENDKTQPKIVLIAGGADKNLDFSDLALKIKEVAGNEKKTLKKLILLDGTATPRLRDALSAAGVPNIWSEPFSNFRQAVLSARAVAEPGDVVLLSPGCASFGMFLHEFDRGAQFRDIVNGL
jgi:UDP-N-acetylmuramoylalanine--D-glutamate ligase